VGGGVVYVFYKYETAPQFASPDDSIFKPRSGFICVENGMSRHILKANSIIPDNLKSF
jgi:hypothetical protein